MAGETEGGSELRVAVETESHYAMKSASQLQGSSYTDYFAGVTQLPG